MNLPAIIEVLEEIEAHIEAQPTLALEGTIYESTEELLEDINDFIIELEEGNAEAVEYIAIHFLKGSTFHLLAKGNGWGEIYTQWLSHYELAIK